MSVSLCAAIVGITDALTAITPLITNNNGKTSRCKDTSMRCYNNAPGTYQVTSRTSYKSGMYAVGNCRAVNKSSTATSSSSCIYSSTATSSPSSIYSSTATSSSAAQSSLYSLPEYSPANKKTGKAYAKMLRFGVTAAGKVVNR